MWDTRLPEGARFVPAPCVRSFIKRLEVPVMSHRSRLSGASRLVVALGAAVCLILVPGPPGSAVSSAASPGVAGSASGTSARPSSPVPALDWGDLKIEYYTKGVIIGYTKGEAMGMRILSSNTCFNGDWVGKGHWLGYYTSAGGKYGNDGDVTWKKGKRLIVKLPGIPIDTVYYRTTKKKAAKVWGTTGRARAALKRCWSP